MTRRILVLSPWGVDYMDKPTAEIAGRHVRSDTELEVRNLGDVAPPLPWPVAGMAGRAVEVARQAEADGFDGIAIGCCADPFLQDIRAAVGIPVSAPSESVIHASRTYGKLTILPRRLSDAYLPLIPTQGNFDFWNGTARKNGLGDGDYTLRAVPVPKHPSPEDLERYTPTDPGLLRDLTIDAMTEALRTSGLEQAKLATAEDGAAALYFACAFWSTGIEGLGLDAAEFGAPVLNPVVAATTYVEQALVAQGK
ncbi:aspartate/glutamate racemase family protein [Microbacterium pygmaeum]|uniref:Allantoin racemase n=1 Tax=Microbacterium pygmaeum TaxID=370764 RepID=A0A1G7XCZ5_9MICO|nr:aspartate/glutamate racemase family protein [Microbacterium pygmaeum]SDG82112.1 allantoin racemase [Microbacterium pygmaeum]